MKTLFIGDYKKNAGPSNVNKNLKRYLPEKVIYLKYSNKLLRIFELVLKSMVCNVFIISGMSKINLITVRISKLLNKKIIYIMHGSSKYENKINFFNNENNEIIENIFLKSSKIILCVSKNYMYWVKENYPEFKEKISYLNNGIEWEDMKKLDKKIKREKYNIITMGGGRPQKNNVMICEAIKHLNKTSRDKFKLIVLGRDYKDTEKIKSYDCVDYIGQVSREEVSFYLQSSNIFIQNSSFEPFGLAPIEALLNGCNIIVSKNVGANCIMKSLETRDIIQDNNNIHEISEKIKYVLENNNNQKIINGIDKEKTSCQYAANKLLKIIERIENDSFI